MYLDWKSPKKFGGHGTRFRNTGANKRVGNDISTGLWCVDCLCILNEWWEMVECLCVSVSQRGLRVNILCTKLCQLQKGQGSLIASNTTKPLVLYHRHPSVFLADFIRTFILNWDNWLERIKSIPVLHQLYIWWRQRWLALPHWWAFS